MFAKIVVYSALVAHAKMLESAYGPDFPVPSISPNYNVPQLLRRESPSEAASDSTKPNRMREEKSAATAFLNATNSNYKNEKKSTAVVLFDPTKQNRAVKTRTAGALFEEDSASFNRRRRPKRYTTLADSN